MHIRRLTSADLPEYQQAQLDAFGAPAEVTSSFDLDSGQPTAFGAFESGMIGKAAAFPLKLHLGGKPVPAHGIADVTVHRAHRGRGVGRALMRAVLEHERTRGVAVSVLYPSVPGVYRSYGYATAAQRECVVLDPASLARFRADGTLRLEQVDAFAAAHAYASLVAGVNGSVTPLPSAKRRQLDLTMRDPRGDLVGMIRLARTGDVLECDFLLVRSEAALATFMAMLGAETGTSEIRLWSAPQDPIWHWFPGPIRVSTRVNPMMRVVALDEAILSRGWPNHAWGEWVFRVEDALLPANSGTFRLALREGQPVFEREDDDSSVPLWPVNEVSALVAGVQLPGAPQWPNTPDDLQQCAELSAWNLQLGF